MKLTQEQKKMKTLRANGNTYTKIAEEIGLKNPKYSASLIYYHTNDEYKKHAQTRCKKYNKLHRPKYKDLPEPQKQHIREYKAAWLKKKYADNPRFRERARLNARKYYHEIYKKKLEAKTKNE